MTACKSNKRRFISFEMDRIRKRVMRAMGKELCAAGFDEVTIMHGWLLGYFHDRETAGDEVFQKTIEQKFGLPKSTVTNILKMMEKKGYITRTSGEHDSRLKAIHLTDKGRQIHFETIKIIDRYLEELEAGITPEEREAFFGIEEKITRKLDLKDKGGEEID